MGWLYEAAVQKIPDLSADLLFLLLASFIQNYYLYLMRFTSFILSLAKRT